MNVSRHDFVESLRKFADFIETNENVPVPNMFEHIGVSTWHSLDKTDLAVIAREAAKAGLKVEKDYTDYSFALKIGEKPYFSAYVDRGVVCRRVDTGEVETYQGYPDDVELVEKTRPKYDWVCDEPLLKAGE